jgi:hypothetical protein
MKTLVTIFFLIAASTLIHGVAIADAFDQCPDPEAARKWVKACMQENPYNTRESCEHRALEKFCKGK